MFKKSLNIYDSMLLNFCEVCVEKNIWKFAINIGHGARDEHCFKQTLSKRGGTG